MHWKKDFNVGYSPERINPGDKDRYLTQIVKVVSADNEITLDKISALYSSIIKAGIFRASSIKVAEAAKVIENTQRDLNIALMNELAIIFNKAEMSLTTFLRTLLLIFPFLLVSKEEPILTTILLLLLNVFITFIIIRKKFLMII